MIKGDKIICIFPEKVRLTDNWDIKTILKKGEIYTVRSVSHRHGQVLLEEDPTLYFNKHRFISLNEYRANKIKKIKKKLV